MPKTDYDEFVEAYSADNEVNLLNGYYERPAMLNLAGDVEGRRILDAGCGSGPLSAALRDSRVLKPGGRLILSLNHPIVYTALNPDGKYFDLAEFTFDAEHAGRTVTYAIWHRPLQAMSDAFTAAGFRISTISEPPIDPDTPAELRPPNLKHPARFISFIFFVLEACWSARP